MTGTTILYTARTHTTGARDKGVARSEDGELDIRFSTPGSKHSGTNPEQLFAAGWSACFEGAMQIVARGMTIGLPDDLAVDAEIDLCSGEQGYFLTARLLVTVPGIERKVAQSLVDAAERTCPYSKAIRGNVDVTITVA